MSHHDHTPDDSGTGGSSGRGRKDEPQYGQRIEGAPPGPSYDAPDQGGELYGHGYGGGQPYGGGQYDQDQYGQGYSGGQQYGQGQYGQDHGGGQQYGGQYGQGQYDQGQYGQGYGGQYGQGYGGQDQHGRSPYGQGHYDMGGYGRPAGTPGKGLGIAALVLGILALLTSWMLGLGFVPGVVGLILGIVAVRKLGRAQGGSKAVPVIGIVLSVLGILASIAFFFVEISFFVDIMNACAPFVEANDEAALNQCISEQMGLQTIPQ